ncbi:MAG: hypothetical protein WCJ01_03365 [Ignavibacteria bacterium]
MGTWITFSDDQSNKLRMFKAVKGVLDGLAPVIAIKPKFADTFTRYTAQVAKIEQMGETKDEQRTGKTRTKNEFKETLILESRRLMGLAENYGVGINNPEIIDACKTSKSVMQKMREADLLSKVKEIRTLLNANKVSLVDFDITQQVITEYEGMVDTFDEKLSSTGSSLSMSSAATKLLKQYFTECDSILAELDNFMFGINTTNQAEYVQYTEARKIDDLGIRHKQDPPPAPPEPGTPDA